MSILEQHNQLTRTKIEAMSPGQEARLATIFGDDWERVGNPGQRKEFGRQFKAAVSNKVYADIQWVRIENSGRYDFYRKLSMAKALNQKLQNANTMEMKMKVKVSVTILLLLCSALSHAGEHTNRKDDFTGETKKVFVTTKEEAASNRAVYVISGYNSKKNTVGFAVQPLSGSTSCDKKYLLLKDSNGEIHKLDADEEGLNKCMVYSLDADLVKKPFRVRIPMHSGADLDIDVDTTSLDLSKL